MNKYELKKRIFRSLKSGSKNLDEIQLAVGKASKKEIQACLDRNSQWIERYGGAYRLKHVLDAPLRPAKHRDWDYGKIQEIQKPTGRPEKYMNPYVDWVPHLDQGGRGTCLPGRTLILMEDHSWLPIYKVNIGDKVITHTGIAREVTKKYTRKWQGRTRKVYVYGLNIPLEATYEHPILTEDGWKEFKNLTTDDKLAIPTLEYEISDKTINSFEKDPEFLWVLGLYLAEGSLDVRRVNLSLNAKELSYFERVKTCMSKYGTSVTYRQHSTNGIVVDIHGSRWVKLFKELGGEYCDKKRINKRLLTLDPKLQLNIFDGWFDGDGCIVKDGKVKQAASTSSKLIRQMQYILMRNGIRGNVQNRWIYEGRKDCWTLEINGGTNDARGYFNNGYYWSKIRKIEEVPQFTGGSVHNLEVAIDNSYIAETVAVHNCCGFAGAYAAWLIQLNLIDPKPSMEEVNKIEYDQIIQTGACNMLVDKKHEYAPSPESVYQICREVEKVNYPSGCYIRGVARALKDWGYNFEKSWLTSKVSTCVGKDSYPTGRENCQKEAAEHRTDGYAQIWSYEQLKDAIYNYGCAVVAVDIHSNYEEHGKVGPFPEPNHDVIGSHALCCVGYDENYVYCLHSWKDFSKIGGFSKRYYENSTGMGYSVIDSTDVIIGMEIHGTVTARCNIPCDITFGSDEYKGKTELKTSWLLDKECPIYVVPSVNPTRYDPPHYEVGVTLTKDKKEVVLDFNFTEKQDAKTWIQILIENILKKIKSILNK